MKGRARLSIGQVARGRLRAPLVFVCSSALSGMLLCVAASESHAARWLTNGQSPPKSAARDDAPESDLVVREQSKVVRLRLGIRLQAPNGAVQRAVASIVSPMDWPEQQVRVVSVDQPRGAQVQTRSMAGTAQQLVLRLPMLARGSDVTCAREYEFTRWTQRLADDAPQQLVALPTKLPRMYLQPSDGIESVHPEIRRFANEATEELDEPLARAEAIFRATQDKIRYVEGEFAGALAGLRAGQGDCEERACLFIAACRAANIPARLVWGPGHCWAEIALATSDGRLVWIPADPSKERKIGVISHFYPILQKGDRFQVPEQPGQPVRYLSPRCTGVGSAPQLELIEELEGI